MHAATHQSSLHIHILPVRSLPPPGGLACCLSSITLSQDRGLGSSAIFISSFGLSSCTTASSATTCHPPPPRTVTLQYMYCTSLCYLHVLYCLYPLVLPLPSASSSTANFRSYPSLSLYSPATSELMTAFLYTLLLAIPSPSCTLPVLWYASCNNDIPSHTTEPLTVNV